MSQFLFDKASMALKAGRHQEASSAYEQALEKEYSIDGWCGLGLCKLFQLSGDVIFDEVIFCFNKAIELDESRKKEIDLRLISYSQLVLEQLSGYAVESIRQLKKAQKDAESAAFWGAVAAGLSSGSKRGTFRNLTGLTAGISAGVSVGKFAEMKSAKASSLFALNLIDTVTSSLKTFIGENLETDEAQDYLDAMREMKNNIQVELDPNFDPKVSNAVLDADVKNQLSETGRELLIEFAKTNSENVVDADEVIKLANAVTKVAFAYDYKEDIENMCKKKSFVFGTNDGFLFASEIMMFKNSGVLGKKDFFLCNYKDLLTLEYKPAGMFSNGKIIINEETISSGNQMLGLKKAHLPFWNNLKELIKNNSEHF